MADRFTNDDLIRLSSSAIAKVDAGGKRGAEKVTHEEIIAMCVLIAMAGQNTPLNTSSTGD